MKHYPNPRPARLAGLQDCIEHMHRRPPSWRLYARLAAMSFVSLGLGLLFVVALYHATGGIAR